MGPSVSDQLVIDVSRDVVTEMAPEEAPLFKSISESYARDPEKTLKARQRKDDELGFGVAAVAPLLTPVVLGVMGDVLHYLWDEVSKSAKSAGSEFIAAQVQSLFKKFGPPAPAEKPSASLTTEQLAQVRKLAIKKARLLGLNETKSNLLADCIIGSLAVAP